MDVYGNLEPEYFALITGDVNVAICARRRMVSSGRRTAKSKEELMNVAIDQVVGVRIGSTLRYDFSKSGVVVEMKDGTIEWSAVIEIKCEGIM